MPSQEFTPHSDGNVAQLGVGEHFNWDIAGYPLQLVDALPNAHQHRKMPELAQSTRKLTRGSLRSAELAG